MRTILLVGERENVAANFAEKLSPFGIEEIILLDDAKGIKSVPGTIEAVVVVHNNSTPMLTKAAKELADARKLPFASVRHQWARALPVLRISGILPPAGRGKHELKITMKDFKGVAIDYLVEQRATGRKPKFGEVEALLQKAFGPNLTLTLGTYKEFSNRAAAIQPLVGPIDPDDYPPAGSTAHAVQYGQLILEENPELVEDLDALYLKIKEIVGDEGMGGEAPDNWPPRIAADTAVRAQKEIWKRDKVARQTAQDRWTKHQIKAELADSRALPAYRVLIAKSKRIWGTAINTTRIPQLRGDLMGEWAAEKLISDATAYPLYVKLCGTMELAPLSQVDFNLLFHTNEIKRVRSLRPHMTWDTSERAILDHLDKRVGQTKEKAKSSAKPVRLRRSDPWPAEQAPEVEPAPPATGPSEALTTSLQELIGATRQLNQGIEGLKTDLDSDENSFHQVFKSIEELRAEIQELTATVTAQMEVLGLAHNEWVETAKSVTEALKDPAPAPQPEPFPMDRLLEVIRKGASVSNHQAPHLIVNKLTLSEGARLVLDPSARIKVGDMVVEAGAIIELADIV